MTFKIVVKTVAEKHGLQATFMPKPIFGINGSGMHVHQSLFKDGENAFYDPAGRYFLSTIAQNFLKRTFITLILKIGKIAVLPLYLDL